MKRKTLGRWFQACLVGSAMAGGCNRQEVPVARNDSDLLPPVSGWAQKDARATAAAVKRTDAAIMPTGYMAGKQPAAISAKVPAPVASIPPVVFADPPAAKAPAPISETPKALPAAMVAVATPMRLEAGKPPTQDDGTIGTGRYGHAADYSWLRGEVEHTRRGWHLRYASMDESDMHGGSVMLADNGQLSELKDGDVYVVKGRLQDPDSHASAPVYTASEVKPIKP